MPRIEGLQQGTPEWLVHRIGMVTASRVADITTKLKSGKYSADREKYIWELVMERICGRAADHFCTPAMEHGIESEPRARAAYEMERDTEVEDGGFWVHDSMDYFGASPDGLVGNDGLLEIKCPTTIQHFKWHKAGVVPEEYKPQMMAQLACTGRKWCDFVSFDDRNVPAKLQILIRRFQPDPKEIAEMEAEIKTFFQDLVLEMGKLAESCQEAMLAE